MRVLIITNLYPPHGRGGAEVVVAQEARELRDAGHQVFVLTTKPFGGFSSLLPRESIEDGIHVYRFFPLNIFWYRHDFKYPSSVRLVWHIIDTMSPHAWLVMRTILKRIAPDEIRTHNLKGIGFTVAYAVRRAIARRRADARLHTPPRWSHFLHDVQLVTPSGLLRYHDEHAWQHRGMPTRLYRALCRYLFGSPPVVRAPSQWVWNAHRQYGFFPNSTFELIRWYTHEHILYSWQSKRPVRFLFVGQLALHKGILFLLDVLREVPGGTCTVHIVGDGQLMEATRILAREMPWIHVHGHMTLAGVKELFRDTDVLLFPSLAHENCPTIIAEALRHKIPVLASSVGGVPEMVQDDMNGWLVEAGNRRAWKEAIQRIVG
ncbi:MAG: glycosyltransferase [Candidatus Magasanikbacteria bacterium]|nr:glycosyltransferase [Candidatus Magasanikbacteria bacterium]